MAVNNSINLPKGNVSLDEFLGGYYQDFSQAICHTENGLFGEIDEKGIPFIYEGTKKNYSVVYIIQYCLIQYEFLLKDESNESIKDTILNCLNWLDDNAVISHGCKVWRSEKNTHYNLEKGWISSMYQGQAISLYLRAFQLFNNAKYLDNAKQIYDFFEVDYKDGGVKRIDENGYLWFEEYPTDPPSYVLNGYIYTIFGILDYYRVTKDEHALITYNKCIDTLKANLHKYDVWYWSVYDQKKEELVSYYYQKNVHIPLMEIMYALTKDALFDKYGKKWKKNLDSRLCRFVVFFMYRIKPRLKKQ